MYSECLQHITIQQPGLLSISCTVSFLARLEPALGAKSHRENRLWLDNDGYVSVLTYQYIHILIFLICMCITWHVKFVYNMCISTLSPLRYFVFSWAMYLFGGPRWLKSHDFPFSGSTAALLALPTPLQWRHQSHELPGNASPAFLVLVLQNGQMFRCGDSKWESVHQISLS